MNRRRQIIKLALQVLAYVLPRVPAHNMDQLIDLASVVDITADSDGNPTPNELMRLRTDFAACPDEPEDETLRLLTQSVDTFLVHCDPADPDYGKTERLRRMLVATSDAITPVDTGEPGDHKAV